MTWWTKQEIRGQLSWSFPCLRGPFSVLVYTSAKGVELILLFTGKFQGMISFQEVLQDLRWNENAKCSLNFHPCYKVLLLQMAKSTSWGETQVSVGQACCLEYKCEWLTDCLLPNWKCSVGIYWHGIIPRRKKKKKERNLTAHFFFFNPCCDFYLISIFFFGNKKLTFLFEFVFFYLLVWKAFQRYYNNILV